MKLIQPAERVNSLLLEYRACAQEVYDLRGGFRFVSAFGPKPEEEKEAEPPEPFEYTED